MTFPLMPKATALWLIDNTPLTFQQIADFCGLHILEIQALADGEIAPKLQPLDPIINRQITKENLDICIKNPQARLILLEPEEVLPAKKGKKYTPLIQRKNKPNAIAWLLKKYPDLSEQDIINLVGTTRSTIETIRDKLRHRSDDLEPRSPVFFGFCSQSALEKVIKSLKEKETLKTTGNIPLDITSPIKEGDKNKEQGPIDPDNLKSNVNNTTTTLV